nr:inositol polyphosphate-4-phosphatase type I A isoform X1 [Bactrocera oleae]XP_036234398.1 inositol polyphosphate-4-phosphatase type I A isoform X1 [Bactrocera oleae]XP_036234399.1 inositol polyphosphate-4-phosphatase type I A isoform X1 [Bactrocera oleae]XP_036234400.1 inositol polyphosphate-4-phosphatase type I A isoform X1 [Bactrocera oleae]XP_036234401.1 inositol polyphosphate-4-phosphatase type I A isoform X1 [Bactrocera oleae]XP_036234402.1 inositol polyphosphate-4-phosphatase type I A
MRFNKTGLATLATNPAIKFEKEGLLIITERQEGFFRRADVNYPRWCKLRGNLLFYLKDHDPQSPPAGLLVLENCRPLIRNEEREFDGFAFILEFEGSQPQRISTRTAKERLEWVKCIQLASYAYLDRQIKYLQDQITIKMGNRIESGLSPAGTFTSASDALLLNTATNSGGAAALTAPTTKSSTPIKVEEDLSEIPICESALSCDSLPCGDHGRLPNTRVVCSLLSLGNTMLWRDFARTEIVERSANPQFLCTMRFKRSDGFSADTLLRFTVYDVRERLSHTAVPLAYAEVALGVIQDATRFRIPLRALDSEGGFITIASWAPETDRQSPPRSTTQVFEEHTKGHRRSQSLPPKLGVKLFVPFQGLLQVVFANPLIHTYRLHSGMGGDISVHEALLESKYSFTIPQQLLTIWILREKELLQEISGMGELGGEWRRRQMDLLDKHLKLLKDYSQAKQNLQQITKEEGPYFKRSSVKTDESLEFIPVNLHLQRMWAQNDTLNRSGVLDIITVGAFTRHAAKGRTGGLIKLLQETKDSPSKFEQGNACKVQAANDAVQAIKQLRKEIVEIMSQLLLLAKSKNPKGMMPLCNEMITKTKTLLNIWEPSLVEEAFAFVEQHRIIEEPDNVLMPMSPFRKITQQLCALDLKSPELEDFATPIVAPPDLWPRTKTPTSFAGCAGRPLVRSNSLCLRPSPSTMDINAIHALHRTVKSYNEQLRNRAAVKNAAAGADNESVAEATFQSLPVHLNDTTTDIAFTEGHFSNADGLNANIGNDISTLQLIDLDDVDMGQLNNGSHIPSSLASVSSNFNTQFATHIYSELDVDYNATALQHGSFLDTKIMSSSPSANYYRPTEEPEPLDLTQLNIEASVMCLVSKIKFLCGRCGSPAIRLRHPKPNMKRTGFQHSPAPPDLVASQNKIAEIEDSGMVSEAANEQALVTNGNGLNLDLTQNVEALEQSKEEVQPSVTNIEGIVPPKKGNKFTDGLDLSLTTDWASELRPSMRKLRHAMDGLLKTARLMHSVQRLQQDMKRNSINLEIMYRRDVSFSQALTALIAALMGKLWGTEITENFIKILRDLGPLAYFEGLLSLYGNETDMWGDMCIAIEDLSAVNFTLTRSNTQCDAHAPMPMPRVTGSRQSLNVLLPVPEHVYAVMPTQETITFKLTPVFFNIGINEKATLAETLGQTREQHRSNWDNFVRLKQYYSRYRKLQLVTPDTPSKHEPHPPATQALTNILNFMEDQLRSNVSKNVKILHLAEDACRLMSGLRFTSCKSAKDRTGMSVTLEQCRVLVQEFNLPAKSVPYVLSTMRSDGTRMDNVFKNIDKRKYAFNLPQVFSLPAMYRPPAGSYGKAET